VNPPEGNLRLAIDWRLFLVALADTYFDYFLSKSTPDDIMHARTGESVLDFCKHEKMFDQFGPIVEQAHIGVCNVKVELWYKKYAKPWKWRGML